MADFDQVGEQFIGYYDSTRGHVREILARENLSEFLPPSPATVLDLGGGDGRDSEWLAKQGYDLTVVDPSSEMLDKATNRFLNSGLNIELKHLEPNEIEETLKPKKFDVILSHGVLMYCVDDPDEHLKTISSLAKEGATVSILTKGFGGALDRALSKQDTEMVTDLVTNEQCINNLGLKTWAFRPETVEKMLGKHALELITWRGVRVATDHDGRDIKKIPKQELAQILKAERLLGRDESTRGLGQMLHYIVRKQL